VVVKNKTIILVFAIGLVSGISLQKMFVQSSDATNNLSKTIEEIKAQEKIKQQTYAGVENKRQLEIASLENRIRELTKKLNTAHKSLANIDLNNNFKKSDKIKSLTVGALVDAGIDESLAKEIIRRKDEAEYWYLELRDRAVREGYVSTPKFSRELRRLKYDDANMRNDLGDDVYDRYLYAVGKHNRVAVDSIMQGSPAEHAGVMIGDVILSYNEKKIFSWQELSSATTSGQRDESVIVNVQRNNEVLNILVPRGPLGIKLEARHVQP
jgi:membrane-associated protease RseP (regulator of RpoE activity)